MPLHGYLDPGCEHNSGFQGGYVFLTLLLVTFAIYVVGISGGVRIWSLEQYILLLLVFFVFALIAYVVVRGLEMRRGSHA